MGAGRLVGKGVGQRCCDKRVWGWIPSSDRSWEPHTAASSGGGGGGGGGGDGGGGGGGGGG